MQIPFVTTRGGFWLAVCVWGASLVVAALGFPARVPMHFDAYGDPDNVLSRSGAVLMLAVIGGVLAAVFAIGAEVAQRTSMRLVNLPDKDWWLVTPAREARLRVMLREDVHRLGIATMWLLAGMVLVTLLVSHQDQPNLGPWAWLLGLPYVLAVLGYAVFMVVVRYRPDVP